MKRRFVIVDSDGDEDRAPGGRGQQHEQVQDAQQQQRGQGEEVPKYGYSRTQIGYWVITGKPPALLSLNTDSSSNSRPEAEADADADPERPASPAATSDELFLPRRVSVPVALPVPDAAGPSHSRSRSQSQSQSRALERASASDSDSSVLTAKYIRSVRNEMPSKGVSSKRRRKSKPAKDGPTFFAKGPAELDPDERLANIRKSLSLIGPVSFSNQLPLKEHNGNGSRYCPRTLTEEDEENRFCFSVDSGINLSENYCSTVDVSRTEIREVRIYQQMRTDYYQRESRNVYR